MAAVSGAARALASGTAPPHVCALEPYVRSRVAGMWGGGSYDAEDAGERSEDAYNSDDEPGLGDELYPPACTAEEADDEGGGGGMVLSNER